MGLLNTFMAASRKIDVVGIAFIEQASEIICGVASDIVRFAPDMSGHSLSKEGYRRATNTLKPPEAFLITVFAPYDGVHRNPALSSTEASRKAVAPMLAPRNLVILECNSLLEVTEVTAGRLPVVGPDLTLLKTDSGASDMGMAPFPEQVFPGKVVQELTTKDCVMGDMTPSYSDVAARVPGRTLQ
jgi:UDP-N-acetyl-D-mannosaminuronic acid dehydrogenase